MNFTPLQFLYDFIQSVWLARRTLPGDSNLLFVHRDVIPASERFQVPLEESTNSAMKGSRTGRSSIAGQQIGVELGRRDFENLNFVCIHVFIRPTCKESTDTNPAAQ